MPAQIDIKEVHWLLDIVQCIDVGVVVLDRQYRVEVWNAFMENHSGLGPVSYTHLDVYKRQTPHRSPKNPGP